MKKAFVIVGTLALVVVAFIVFTNISRNIVLASQDNFIRTIELPDAVERIAVRSAIGDSGGSGDHRTFRSVMLVRTELTRENLMEIIIDLGLCRRNSDESADYFFYDIFVREASGYQFRSPNSFRLEFEELRDADMLDGYYFIELIR